MSTGYFTHKSCTLHDMGRGHPECPERLHAINDRLLATGVLDALAYRDAPAATREHLLLAHTPEHLSHVAACNAQAQHLAEQSTGGVHCTQSAQVAVDADTSMNQYSFEAALHAAGAAVAATDAVIAGDVENAFCSVRPPGHHATRGKAMGFCLFNNVAIAAKHALQTHGLQRVAVVDFDVHHGNGTEDIASDDPRMLMVGFFQHPFYPYSGAQPLAAHTQNLPVPAYTRGLDIREVFALCLERLEAFKPELIFISAGFDAHREDDLGQLGLNEQDYAWMTQQILDCAQRHSKGRVVSCLEGGYNLNALARSVEAHVRVLASV